MLPAATKSITVVSLATFKQWLKVTSGRTKSITMLTSSGLVASATSAAHGYATNDFVIVAGAATAGYNGSYLITVVDVDHFTFSLAASASSPASGTMTVTPDDGRYAEMINAASAEFENNITAFFVTRTRTETFDGDDKEEHILNYAPVVSITSVTIDGGVQSSASYVFDAETGILSFTDGTTFTAGIKNCAVVYVCGYDVQDGAALPSDIVRGVMDLGKAIHDELVNGAIAASSVNLGPMNMVLKPSQYPASVKRVLDAWSGVGMRP